MYSRKHEEESPAAQAEKGMADMAEKFRESGGELYIKEEKKAAGGRVDEADVHRAAEDRVNVLGVRQRRRRLDVEALRAEGRAGTLPHQPGLRRELRRLRLWPTAELL